MAEDKKSFVLYSDQRSIVDMLPNDKAGMLFKTVFSYVNDENPKIDDLTIKLAFEPFKLQLKRDLKKWEGIKEVRSKAGKASAEARRLKKQSEQKPTSVESVEQKPTDSTVNVNVNDNVNVSVNEIEIKDGVEVVYSDSIFNWLFSSEILKVHWNLWKNYKKKEFNFKYKSDISEKTALSRLKTLSDSDPKKAVKLINESISNGWKGFFKSRDDNPGPGKKQLSLADKMKKDYDIE